MNRYASPRGDIGQRARWCPVGEDAVEFGDIGYANQRGLAYRFM